MVLNQSLDSEGVGRPVNTDGALRPAKGQSTKGQWHFSLADPPWSEGPGGQGRFTAYPLGDDDHGPMVVLVEYAPG